jgi:hypothetical protein
MLKVMRQQINLSHSSTEKVDRNCLNSGHCLPRVAKAISKDKPVFNPLEYAGNYKYHTL